MTEVWDEIYSKRPLCENLSKTITIDIVGNRCVYINNHRVEGGKPYVSENLPTKSKNTTIRNILEAFTTEDIEAYLKEKIATAAYFHAARNYRDALESAKVEQINKG
jgi:hypothetical protein